MQTLIVACALAAAIIVPGPARAAEAPQPKRVLVIHQYSVDMPFRTAFDPAFLKAIHEAISGPVEIYSEALETYRFPSREHDELMRDYFRRKYRGRHLEAVVAVYDTALRFVRMHRLELFPDVPIVAFTSRPIEREAGEPVTGVSVGSTIAETGRLALRLHPGARQLYVIDGALQNSGALLESAHSLAGMEPGVVITYLIDRPLQEVVAALRQAPPNSVVLYLRQLIGASGQSIDQGTGLEQIVAASTLPVYATSESLVGSGIVGGYVASVEGNAALVAKLAARAVGGEGAEAIPPVDAMQTPLFDGRALRHWRIEESVLPPGSRVLFDDPTPWQAYRDYVLAAAAIVAAQALLIGALLAQRFRRRRAEQALRHSESRNLATLRAMPDRIFLLTRDGVFLECRAGQAGEDGSHPAVGQRVTDIMPAATAERFIEELSRASAGGEPRALEYTLADDAGAGGERTFEARLVGCDDDRVLCVVRDVTEERCAHVAVVQSRQRYALATSACGVGVWDWNLDTGEFYIDPTFLAILGYGGPQPRHLGAFLQFVHLQDRAETEVAARACIERRSMIYWQEHRMIAADGSVRWFHCRGSVVADERGERSRLVGTFSDVTERRETEEALRRSEAALRARGAEVQQLAGRLIAAQESERQRIARDLHDDLSQKLALLAINIERLGMRSSDSAVERALQLRDASKYAAEIASDVHQLSHQLHPSKLDVLGLAGAIHSVCREMSAQFGIDVEFAHDAVAPGVQPDVALCLYRIVQESLRNVVKHSGAKQAMVRIAVVDGDLQLQIADQGCGFDILSPSAVVGLGLVTMRERVNFVGGEIVVHAAPGRGTRIGVRVPSTSAWAKSA
jgi:two-component system sensor histidine kinase UhpB